ncbi:MAG TPA: DUF3501 family protein [Thermoanaerobaculia bacterium]|nr:DUF3501 family protein [Thermoanaerobaculia bacterium]
MNGLVLSDIRTLHEYELERPEFRARVIELKKRRRVAIGPAMTIVFENRDTVRFQIQEMARIERIVRPERVQEELDVYNELLPRAGEVAATLFIEVTEPEKIRSTLEGLVGLDEPGKLRLVIGDRAYPAVFAAGQSREDRISAVHYVRFPVGQEGRSALAGGAPARIEVRHGGYEAAAPLSADVVAELLTDLAS